MKRCEHDYRRWKVLSIKNENEVETVMEFTFPNFHQGTSLYFNENRDRMILKIVNFRTFIYKIHKYPGTSTNEVYFELIRQIIEYPDELENDYVSHGYFSYFTPCFGRFIKLDRKSSQFVIIDSYTGDVVKMIPKDIMYISKKSFDEKKIKETVNRIKFIDFSTMLIVNEEGIEKLMNID